LVRNFVKWDDQPASAEAAVESILRANQITRTDPQAPVYVCLDAHMQEAALDRKVAVPPIERFKQPAPIGVDQRTLASINEALRNAKHPLLLAGRVSRGMDDWNKRIAFAEAFGLTVLSSANNAPAYPVSHPLHILPPAGDKPTKEESELIAQSDLILSLDWLDLAGFLRARGAGAQTQTPTSAKVIHCSLDGLLTNGWSMDHQALAAIDIAITAHPDALVRDLLDVAPKTAKPATKQAHWQTSVQAPEPSKRFDLLQLATGVTKWSEQKKDVSFARLPIGWPTKACPFNHPLDFLGKDGGGTVGTGPAHTVGAALALKGSGRSVVGIIGDGDFLMGMNALWTAANQDLSMLLIIANNQSYYNDEVHQERIAIQRGRPVENKGIGQKLENPVVDLNAIAAAQGFETALPVTSLEQLEAALMQASKALEKGGRFFINAHIIPGYAS
jgi:benzoylformate decarboxylase